MLRFMSPVGWALLAVCAVAGAYGTWAIAADPDGNLEPWGAIFMLCGATVVGWAVLESLWRRDPSLDTTMAALIKTGVLSFVVVPALGVVKVITAIATWKRYAAHADGNHYWLGTDSWVGSIALFSLVEGMAALLLGLLIAVVIVIPFTAFLRPKDAIRGNLLSTKRPTWRHLAHCRPS